MPGEVWHHLLGAGSGTGIKMDDSARGDANETARSVFAGLVPTTAERESTNRLSDAVAKGTKGLMATVPIVLVGSMAAFTLTGPIAPANARPAVKPRGAVSELGKTLRDAIASANVAIKSTSSAKSATAIAASPTIYRVVADDTVSEIAGRFGLSTASVLALNGLSWSSVIFPGQELRLTSHGPVVVVEAEIETTPIGRYTIVAGDTISAIANHFGVSTLSVLTANGLGWSSIIYPGQTIAIPGLVGLDDEEPPRPNDEASDPIVRRDDAPLEQESSTDRPAAPVVPEPAPVTPAPAPAPAPAPDPAPAPVPINGVSHTVQSGQTLSGIAALYAISTQHLLDANGLSWESIIYPGNVLSIPGGSIASVPSGDITGLTAEMRANAAIIVQVGRDLGVPDYGIIIALATAMQESSLRNINWGDRDSVGLFQQRPSSGWGSIEQLTTPTYAARLFYGGPSNPNVGRTRGLLDISGWQSLSVTRAAQAVQISAYPDAYAKWESSARMWFAELT